MLMLEPFYKIHDARYMMYWMALSNAGINLIWIRLHQ